MIVVYIFVLLCMFVCLIFKSKRFLHMLQQNLYNENNRYLKWVFRNSKQFLDLDLIIILGSLVGLFVLYDLEKFSIVLMVILGILFLALAYLWRNRLAHDQNKKPLVITKRVRRLIVTTSILYLIPVVFLLIKNDDLQFAWIMITLLSPNLKIIGITGSYGKTSSKNILSDILNIKYNALPTPRNLNTYNGLIMTVNNNLTKFNDIFIAEMGAYVKGEIKGLCKLVKPQYGILTRLGTAHLESFGSEQNINK